MGAAAVNLCGEDSLRSNAPPCPWVMPRLKGSKLSARFIAVAVAVCIAPLGWYVWTVEQPALLDQLTSINQRPQQVQPFGPLQYGGNISVKRGSRQNSLFCYTLTGYPYPETLPALVDSFRKACDGWAVFSSRDDASIPATKVYDQSKWDHHFYTFFREPMREIWSKLLSPNAPRTYDFYLKVDTDTFVNACSLRLLFDQHDPTKNIV